MVYVYRVTFFSFKLFIILISIRSFSFEYDNDSFMYTYFIRVSHYRDKDFLSIDVINIKSKDKRIGEICQGL